MKKNGHFQINMKKLLGIVVQGYRIIWDRPDTNQTLIRVRTKCSLANSGFLSKS